MNELEKLLHRLPKPQPSSAFQKAARQRLMSRIRSAEPEDSWLGRWIGMAGPAVPSSKFILSAKARLMAAIDSPPSVLRWSWALLRRLTASALVMLMAVTTTLFFVEGGTVVVASQESYAQVLSGAIQVQRPNQLAWTESSERFEVGPGDLIRVPEGSQATLHFFDDSQLRLEGGSTLLINRIQISPAYASQGSIEAILSQGRAWLQVLNVEDGHAGFTLVAPQARFSALRASLSLQADAQQGTSSAQVWAGRLTAQAAEDSRGPQKPVRLNEGESVQAAPFAGLGQIRPLGALEKDAIWVRDNLALDQQHLDQLRQASLRALEQKAGTLPGELLYPIKRAKELLSLAWQPQDKQMGLQIELANRRLGEAAALFQNGQAEKAKEALAAYQALAQQVASKAKEEGQSQAFRQKIVLPYQKDLIAALPTTLAVAPVKEALRETEALLAEDPLQKAALGQEHALQSLEEARMLAESGRWEEARVLLESARPGRGEDFLALAAAQESEEEKRVLIEGFQDLRQEEALLLERIAQAAQAIPEPDEALLALVDEASRATAEDLSLAQSQLPQPALPPSDPPLPSAPELSPAARLAQRILIYSTLQGQSNQMERLLDGQESLGFLTELKGLLPARTGDLLGRRILEAQRKERAEAGEQVEARIEEAQAQYQQSLEGLKLAEPMPAEAAPTSVPLLLPAPAEPALAPIEAPIPAEAETEAERTLP